MKSIIYESFAFWNKLQKQIFHDIIIFWDAPVYSAAWKFVNPLEFSIFLYKYDPKHHQIFIRVLKVDREPNQTSERKILSLSFIYWDKWSSVTYLCVAKVRESLGLAVDLN